MSLLFIWLAALVLACAACVYFIASIQMRRIAKVDAASPERSARMRAFADRIGVGLEIAGGLFFVVLICALALNAVQLFRLNENLNSASQQLARRFIADEYQPYQLSPTFAFAVSDDWTVGGASPHVGDAIVITAKLLAQPPPGGCSAGFLAELASRATLRLESPDLKLSAKPALDATHACFITWRWIGVPVHPGVAAAIVELDLREARRAALTVSKPIHFAVPVPSEPAALVPSITSIAVALLSILGALLTHWLNSRSAKINAAEA